MVVVLVIFFLVLSFIIQSVLTAHFYAIGLADFPPDFSGSIPLLQFILLPIVIPLSDYLFKKYLKSPKKFSRLLMKIMVIVAISLITAFIVWNLFVPQIVPQMIFDDTQKALEEKDLSKVIFRYGRIATLYPEFAKQTSFKAAQNQVEAMLSAEAKNILMYIKPAREYRFLGNYGKALEILEKGQELNFENAELKNKYGEEKAKEIKEIAASFYEELSLVYSGLGQEDKAVEAAEKASKLYSESAIINLKH